MTAFLLLIRPHLRWLLPALGMVVLVSGIYLKGRHDGREACQRAQEAAEKRADAKAARVAKSATERAEKAADRIHERTEEAADEIDRQMEPVCPAVPVPDGVRDALDAAARRAREALPSDPR